jgi:FMN-dependent NADH-azoreductase
LLLLILAGENWGEVNALNSQEPYLRTIFSYVGITDITFVIAEPTDMGHELEVQRVNEAKEHAKAIATGF